MFTQTLATFINDHYSFRVNVLNKVLGKDTLEYQRINSSSWIPMNHFIGKELKRMKRARHLDVSSAMLALIPNWLIEKIARKQGANAETFIENPKLLQLLDEPYVFVSGIRPLSNSQRTKVELNTGDKCYMCFGGKKSGLFVKKRKFLTLPGIVESVHKDGFNTYYNIFLMKVNKKKGKVDHHGRHMVYQTEIGKTPEEAVQNMAVSQLVY